MDDGEVKWTIHTWKKASKQSKAIKLDIVIALPTPAWTQQPYSVVYPCKDSLMESAVAPTSRDPRKMGVNLPHDLVKSTRFLEILMANKGKKKVIHTERHMPSQGL